MSEKWPAAGLVLVALIQFTQVFNRAINWDEFWHYSHIVQFQRGTLSLGVLQSLHARIYGWATALPGSEIDHIIAIRVVMFTYEMIVAAAIAGLAAKFTDRRTGWLCALAYLAFPYVFQHGYSFRFDPPLAMLLMSILWLLACTRMDWKTLPATAILIGLLPLVSIKFVLYAPAAAGILWLRWSDAGSKRDWLVRTGLLGVASMAAFALFFWMHSHGIPWSEAAESSHYVGGAGKRMFALEAKPYWPFALMAVALAPLTSIAIAMAPKAILKAKHFAPEKVALFGLWLPLTTLIFYHNTAPYYYVFMLPPVLVASGMAFAWLAERYSAAAVAFVLVLTALITFASEDESPLGKQRELATAAQAIFPQPVRYFDFMAFLGEFEKANPFMSTVVTRNYLEAGKPVFREAMETAPVPLLVVNSEAFATLMGSDEDLAYWLPEDASALRSNYVHYWGPYWIAGHDIPAGAERFEFVNLVPGRFRVEGETIALDGKVRSVGREVVLSSGKHTVSGNRAGSAQLVWADAAKAPTTAPPEQPWFLDF